MGNDGYIWHIHYKSYYIFLTLQFIGLAFNNQPKRLGVLKLNNGYTVL